MAKHFRLRMQEPREAQVLDAVRSYLSVDRRVAMVWRQNVAKGLMQRPDGSEQWVEFGERGQSDLLGMLADGRFLAVECKSPRGTPTADQRRFIGTVMKYGGVAGVCRSVEDAIRLLDWAHGPDWNRRPLEILR